MIVPLSSRLFPHFEHGLFYCYGNNQAYNCDPTSYEILQQSSINLPFTKFFNNYLTQPVLFNSSFYATFDNSLFKLNQLTVQLVETLPFKTMVNCLISSKKLIVASPYQFTPKSDFVTSKPSKGLTFQQDDKIFNFHQNCLTLLSPDFSPLEVQHLGELLFFGSGQAIFKKNGTFLLKCLFDNAEFSCQEISCQVRYSFGEFGAIPDVKMFKLDESYVNSKYKGYLEKQQAKQQINTRINFFVAENEEITSKITFIEGKWKEIENEFNKTQVGLYGFQQETNEIKLDIEEAIQEQKQRINDLKKKFEVKVFKEKIGIQ